MEIGSHGKGVHKQAEEPIQGEESRIHTMGFLSIAIEESFRLRKQEIAKKQQAMVNESVKWKTIYRNYRTFWLCF